MKSEFTARRGKKEKRQSVSACGSIQWYNNNKVKQKRSDRRWISISGVGVVVQWHEEMWLMRGSRLNDSGLRAPGRSAAGVLWWAEAGIALTWWVGGGPVIDACAAAATRIARVERCQQYGNELSTTLLAIAQIPLGSTRLDSTRHVRLCGASRASRASRDERVERDEPCCSNMADVEQAIGPSVRLYKFN